MPRLEDPRRYSAVRPLIELDGSAAGWPFSADGGQASADVVVEKPGPDRIARKHIAGVKYDDISVSCGAGMSKSFYEWLSATLSQKDARKNGAIISANYDGKEVSRLTFYNAQISEITLPELDASAKDAARMTIKIAPEYTRREAKSGAPVVAPRLGPAAQKQWLPSNFRIKIGDLDCTRVNQIGAITVKQHLVEQPVGDSREYEQLPGYLEIPNLALTLPEAYAQDFFDWHADFVIKGNSGQENEKQGVLEYLAPNLQDILFSLTLKQLGIFKLSPAGPDAGSEAIRQVRAEMYCEEIEFAYFAGAVAAGE